MALAVTSNTELQGLSGGVQMRLVTLTPDTAYPTGGTAGITALLGFGKILAFVVMSSLGYEFEYLPATDKLKAWNSTGAALNGPASEVANTTNMSASGALNALVIGTD